jgi:trk system potassium uptake protein TrkH
MNKRGVFHAVGAITIFVGAAMVLPLGAALFFGDGGAPGFGISMGVTLLTGCALFLLTRGETDLGVRDGFGVVTFGWLAMALFGSLPFLMSGSIPNPVDALFETMSGFTTTGASILSDPEVLPRSALLWRSLIQWLGGMGIIVLSLAILPMLGVGGMQLYRAEAPGPSPDKLRPRIRQTAATLWGVYVVLSIAEALLLRLAGMGTFDAVCHTFTTMATGGFSTRTASLAAFPSPTVQWIVTLFMFLAGANFALHYRALRGNVLAYVRDPEWRLYLWIVVLAVLGASFGLWVGGEHDPAGAIRAGSFQVVSILTTTGFVTEDYGVWHPGLQWGLLVLMFVGGCAGSTAGSLKVVRVFVLAKAALRELAVVGNPRVVRSLRIGRRKMERGVARNVLGFFLLFAALCVAGTAALSILGLDLETALSASTTCLANVGPGLGQVGPTDHFAWIPTPGKWVLMALMLLGRLELYTVLVLFLPAAWRK